MIRNHPLRLIISLLVFAGLALVVREPAAAAYQEFLAWIYAEQRNFHKLMTESLSTFADKTGWSAGTAVVFGSFLYGVFHAAGPGHGKVILSTYLLTQPERIGKSVAMSVASAFMQGFVAVVLVYGLFYLFGIAARDAKIAVLWSERISFAIIIGLGAMLVWRAARGLHWIGVSSSDHGHDHHHHHDHDHNHHHQSHHAHDGDGVCQTCGHSHMPTSEQMDSATDWRSVMSVIVSIGLRPCSGAVLVLVFAKFSGIPLAGVLAVAAISAGTAITVSVLAVMSVKARGLAVSLLGATAGRIDTVGHLVALAGGGVLILLGYGLLANSWSAPVRSMGL